MPKLSKSTAPHTDENPALVSHHGPLGDYTVMFETYRMDADGAPFFRGLPDDRCQSPHWGYVISGRVTFRYADREETFETGDAYYAPPGHVPLVEAGTEVVEFSDAAQYAKTTAVIAENLAALASGA
jgi:mannose-6-phosphate isomerase-like protein (cupin superfamily)